MTAVKRPRNCPVCEAFLQRPLPDENRNRHRHERHLMRLIMNTPEAAVLDGSGVSE